MQRKGIVYTADGQPITLWPVLKDVYDETGEPTGEQTTNLEELIATLPPGTPYELVTEEESIAWLESHKPAPTEEEIRAQRDALLAETDYLMLPDYPISDETRAAVTAYRQALRDVTGQEGFPETVIWPEKPEGV